MIRLQKYMASCGVASRRKCEALIEAGKVKVGDQIITELGFKVDPDLDRVYFNGVLIKPETEKVYILLNKPTGYITSVKDQFDRQTVIDLIQGIDARIYPVGRLDYDTSGLLLLTNDGDMTNQITHPSHKVEKTYLAKVKGQVSKLELKKIQDGIDIGGYVTAPSRARIIKTASGSTTVELTIHEGKNRQVRRMFEAINHPVMALERIAIGKIKKGSLKEGTWRLLNDSEIQYLKGERK
jgi:23S rRNA pseudouridine2605 synthase